MKLRTWTNTEQRLNILHSTDGLRSPRKGTLAIDALTLDGNGRLVIPPGTVFYRRQADRLFAPLPWTRLTAAAAASATELAINKATAAFFKAAQVLRTTPHARVNLTGVWAQDDTLQIAIGNASVTATATGATLADVAGVSVAAINNDPVLSEAVEAIVSGDNFHIFSTDGRLHGYHPISVTATTAGSGDAAIEGGNTTLTPLAVGTVATNGVDIVNGTLALEAGTTLDLPIGAPIRADFAGKISGWLPAQIIIPDDSDDLGLAVSGTPETHLMPHWDAELSSRFPMTVGPME